MQKQDQRLWRLMVQAVRPFPLTIASGKLLVGVSGGADSLALLHLLGQQLGANRLVVGHLNHQLRPEADEEANFVRETAASWHIPCIVKSVAVADLAKQSNLSLEAAGRLARYRFLAETAEIVNADAVVVGHHADDQAETVLLHLLRGSGSGGLRGMQAVSVVPGREQVVLLRPFLTISRTEIEAYCARHGLQYQHDASNEDVQFARNRIRHELLLLLQTYNPQIYTNLQQLAAITADEFAALQAAFSQIWPELLVDQGENWLFLDRAKFVAQRVAWQRLALRRAVQELRPFISEIGFATIELARELILAQKSGTQATLPGNLAVRVGADRLFFGAVDVGALGLVPQLVNDGAVPLPVPGKVALANGWVVEAKWADGVSAVEIQQNEELGRSFVAVSGDLWVRPFQPGERFQPLGMGGQSQKIADLLSNRKVDRDLRPLWPIVASADHPVWIVGLQMDERARVEENSLRPVQLICYRDEGV